MKELSWNFLGGTEKQDKTSVRVAGVSAEIRNGPRPNRGVTTFSTARPI